MHAIAIITLKDRRTAVIDANPPGAEAALRAIMVVHTRGLVLDRGVMVYVLYAVFARRSDRRAGIAAAVVAAESLIAVGSGCRLPAHLSRGAAGHRAAVEMKSVTAFMTWAVCSSCGLCPARSMILSRALRIAAAS
jgi:hypothetical protein